MNYWTPDILPRTVHNCISPYCTSNRWVGFWAVLNLLSHNTPWGRKEGNYAAYNCESPVYSNSSMIIKKDYIRESEWKWVLCTVWRLVNYLRLNWNVFSFLWCLFIRLTDTIVRSINALIDSNDFREGSSTTQLAIFYFSVSSNIFKLCGQLEVKRFITVLKLFGVWRTMSIRFHTDNSGFFNSDRYTMHQCYIPLVSFCIFWRCSYLSVLLFVSTTTLVN